MLGHKKKNEANRPFIPFKHEKGTQLPKTLETIVLGKIWASWSWHSARTPQKTTPNFSKALGSQKVEWKGKVKAHMEGLSRRKDECIKQKPGLLFILLACQEDVLLHSPIFWQCWYDDCVLQSKVTLWRVVATVRKTGCYTYAILNIASWEAAFILKQENKLLVLKNEGVLESTWNLRHLNQNILHMDQHWNGRNWQNKFYGQQGIVQNWWGAKNAPLRTGAAVTSKTHLGRYLCFQVPNNTHTAWMEPSSIFMGHWQVVFCNALVVLSKQ